VSDRSNDPWLIAVPAHRSSKPARAVAVRHPEGQIRHFREEDTGYSAAQLGGGMGGIDSSAAGCLIQWAGDLAKLSWGRW
jgi:hypothetical protein